MTNSTSQSKPALRLNLNQNRLAAYTVVYAANNIDRIEVDIETVQDISNALEHSLELLPVLPEQLDKRVSVLADQVYALDELAYYLDVPESDVIPDHLREAAMKLLAQTIRFIQSLPNE